MNLECLNNIITDNLVIDIDLTNVNSWINFNSDLTAFSLTKWSEAIVDNINLNDFGLTDYDNGKTDIMWSGITLTPNNDLFSVYKVGYNTVINPTTGQTSGFTSTTHFLPITGITSTTGNYFNLNGGYVQGFFKLQDYNYTLLPSRYGKGITIETILKLSSSSHGIFYMMGARAEDKYNSYFSGETKTGSTTTGIITSEGNYLNALIGDIVTKKSFQRPEENTETIYSETAQINNLKNNVIAFEITTDRRLGYKYLNNNGLVVSEESPIKITATGFTMIDLTFTPYENIYDLGLLKCMKQRMGTLMFYVNGRAVWIIKDFPEFYFHGFSNQKEKVLGIPYSISWGGGSFGLKYSWHYDYQKYNIYDNQDNTYITTHFSVHDNPLVSNNLLSGISLSANTNAFNATVMEIVSTGATGNTYFVKFNNPISVLSNRNYTFTLSLNNHGLFKNTNNIGEAVNNKLSILAYSDTVDVSFMNSIEYVYPITSLRMEEIQALGLHPFQDNQEYQYIYPNGVMYYGETGIPVLDEFGNENTFGYEMPINLTGNTLWYTTGVDMWNELKAVIRTSDNTGQSFINVGLLIETTDTLNLNSPLFISGFTYTASDILVHDTRKNNLTIEENFNTSFIGGIQKLRIYNNALTSPEVLHNALMETKVNPNIIVSKGGRIITYRV